MKQLSGRVVEHSSLLTIPHLLLGGEKVLSHLGIFTIANPTSLDHRRFSSPALVRQKPFLASLGNERAHIRTASLHLCDKGKG